MRYSKLFALTIAISLMMSIFAFTTPVDAQGNSGTRINLGIKKNFDGKVTGDPDSAFPSLVRVGETHLIYGRIMELPYGRYFQALPDAEIKLIDNFNNAQDPIVLATSKSDEDGFFIFEWKVSAKKFKEIGVYKVKEGIGALENLKLQISAVYDGSSTNAKSTSRGYIVALKPLRLDIIIQADKQIYAAYESAQISVTIRDPEGQLIDPDKLEVFFGSTGITPIHRGIGSYFFTSPALSENLHKVTVLADKADYLRETITATITVSTKVSMPADLIMRMDRSEYTLGDFTVITGTAKPLIEGRPVLINVMNPNGVIHNFGQITPDLDGTFSYEFRIGGTGAIAGEWSIIATFLGLQVKDSFTVSELAAKLLPVSLQSSSLSNELGEKIDEGSIGIPVGIKSTLTSNESQAVSLLYIVKVTNAEGFTVLITWIKGMSLDPLESNNPTIFWIPEKQDDYKIEIFVWESLEEPNPLSRPEALKLRVI